jgi:hypothetical protein
MEWGHDKGNTGYQHGAHKRLISINDSDNAGLRSSFLHRAKRSIANDCHRWRKYYGFLYRHQFIKITTQ